MKLSVVDDHEIVSFGVSEWMRRHAPGVHVVYFGPSLDEGIAAGPDVILLDVDRGPSSLSVPEAVGRATRAGIKVVMLSATQAPYLVHQALRAGASGYLGKEASSAEILDAINEAHAGGIHISEASAAALAELPELSDRELQVLRLFAGGFKIDTVARRLGVAPSTVQEYLKRIREKFSRGGASAGSPIELRDAADRQGFTSPFAGPDQTES